MPVTTALHGFFGTPILKDLTTREWDTRFEQPYSYDGMRGSSSGALAALALLQATSDCVFRKEVSECTPPNTCQLDTMDCAGIMFVRLIAPVPHLRSVSWACHCDSAGGYDGPAEPDWEDVVCRRFR
jgi:hypothetical protein